MPHPMSDHGPPEGRYDLDVGLCSVCHHARKVKSARASVFYLCGLSQTDRRFAKYPRLPVAVCEGFLKEESMAHPAGAD
jgi:hypothetical protein